MADIVDGHLQPGDELPRQIDLAAQLGIGKTTVSELLRELEDRGLVTIRHGSGVTVNASEKWDLLDGDVLAALLQGSRRASLLSDFVSSLRLIESRAAELAAQRADPQDLARLELSLQELTAVAARGASGPEAEDELVAAMVAFHHAVFAASANPTLRALMDRSDQAMQQMMRALSRPGASRARMIADHALLLEAIRAHDGAAARAAVERRASTLERALDDVLAASSR